MTRKIRVGTVVWGHISGYPWWPGLVVPYETVLFLPPDAEIPKRDDNMIVVQWFSDGRISQLPMKDVELYRQGRRPVSQSGIFSDKALDRAVNAANAWLRPQASNTSERNKVYLPF